jgi:hypothetical protein
MELLTVGGIRPTGKIENSIMTVTGSSPRVYYDGPWLNVDFSTDVLAVENITQSYLVARSNHEDRPKGFGGYIFYIDFEDKAAFFKKENWHGNGGAYSDRLASVSIDVSLGKWFNQKIICKNEGSTKVKLEAYINNKLVTSLTDSGQIACGDTKNTPPHLVEAKWCFTRANGIGDEPGTQPGVISYKNLSIKNL